MGKDQFETTAMTVLRMEIEGAGESIASMALKLGRDEGTYRRWVRGIRSMPIQVLYDTLSELEIPATEFFADVERRMNR